MADDDKKTDDLDNQEAEGKKDDSVTDAEKIVKDYEEKMKGLINKNAELLKETKKAKEAKRKLEAVIPEGFDPDQFKTMQKEIDSIREKKLLDEGDFDKIKEDLVKRYEKQNEDITKQFKTNIEEKDEKISKLSTELKKEKIDNRLREALVKHKGSAALLMPTLQNFVKLQTNDEGEYKINVVDPEGNPRLGMKGDPMTIDELVSEFKESDTYAVAFEGSKATGGGAVGGDGSRSGGKIANPWKKESLNLTKQAEIQRDEPQLASKLRAEAAA